MVCCSLLTQLLRQQIRISEAIATFWQGSYPIPLQLDKGSILRTWAGQDKPLWRAMNVAEESGNGQTSAG